MGFKCPVCNEDFGTSRHLFQRHVDGAHNGQAGDFVSAVQRAADPVSNLINTHAELGIPIILNLAEPVTSGPIRVPDPPPQATFAEDYIA